jgi:[NiFe] hydrogenase diaphorase moiety large subunit
MLKIAYEYMAFFEEESCGYCTPCRVGNVLLKRRLEKIIEGKGEPKDLDYLNELGESIKYTSRCGMGQTSPNPVLTTLKNFRSHYEKLIKEPKDGMQPDFDIKDALSVSEDLIGRKSVIY